MKAAMELTKKTYLEETISSKDMEAISRMIARKEKALKEATDNAEFYASIGQEEMADNEASRAKRLAKDIERLKAV